MLIEAVIFDLDGVICRTDQLHFQAWKAAANRLGIPFDEGVNARLRGVSRMESLEIVLERSGRTVLQEEKERLSEEKNQIYRSLLRRMTPADLPPETSRVLHTLRRMGIFGMKPVQRNC